MNHVAVSFHELVQTNKDKTFSPGRKGELCAAMTTYAAKLPAVHWQTK